MKKLAPFLDKYDIILFDMDGVITSEQRYWDAAALAVYEFLNDDYEIDTTSLMKNVAEIRKKIFCGDKTISLVKERGVNSNWDLVYLVIAAAKILNTIEDFEKIHDYISNLNRNAFEMYDYFGANSPIGKRGDELYKLSIQYFQEWYLGDKIYKEIYKNEPKRSGKTGLVQGEQPILPLSQTKEIIKLIHDAGKKIGIGTGRVKYEIVTPLEHWGLSEFLDSNRLITYSDVEFAEAELKNVTLTKPHPFMFLKGMLGKDYSNEKLINSDYDKSLAETTLVVGDAGADMLSAQSANIPFAAVLTGISGLNAKGYFEQNRADYILGSIADFLVEV